MGSSVAQAYGTDHVDQLTFSLNCNNKASPLCAPDILGCAGCGAGSSPTRSIPRKLQFAVRIPGTSSRLDRTTRPVVRDNEFHVLTGSTDWVVWRHIAERTASTAPGGSGP